MKNPNNILTQLLALEPVEVDEASIYQRTAEKLGLAAPAKSPVKTRVPRYRTLRAFAIAAVLVVFTGTAAFAGYSALQMGKQPIEYFAPDAASGTPVSTPTFHTAALASEEYNAVVGQSVDAGNAIITLDAVAADDNFINAFFTIVYNQPLDLSGEANEGVFFGEGAPAYARLRTLMPYFEVSIDGEAVLSNFNYIDGMDPYMTDERTVKLMVHQLLPTMTPDEFSLTIASSSFGAAGALDKPFEFNLSIDKASAALKTQAVEPASFSFDTGDGIKPLNIKKLALTPFGGLFTVSATYEKSTVIDPYGQELESEGPNALLPEGFLITDSLGNIAYTNGDIGMSMPLDSEGLFAVELYGLSPEATSITLTPLRWKGYENSVFESRAYSIADTGQRIETSSLGGLIYDGCEIEGNRMTYRFTPYGYTSIGDVMPEDEGLVTLTANRRTGLAFHTFDAATGQYVYAIDYYAAAPGELQSIKTFHIAYNDYAELDTAAAVTLPLQAVAK